MKYAIMFDFGSTYTKMVCVDLMEKHLVVTAKVPSTVHNDASIGMNQCISIAEDAIGRNATMCSYKLATSSAAGGLRIAVSGLTKNLSYAAGHAACCSAGGKIVASSYGRLTESDVEHIREVGTEIILLCGGYEKGNHVEIMENAETLSRSGLQIPVIYAGNSSIGSSVRGLFISQGMECFLAENIIPEIGVLNVASTTDIIRDLFLSRITNMIGVGAVSKYLDEPIMPTPQAVLRAGELLSRGIPEEKAMGIRSDDLDMKGIGNLMIVDLGGATTDVYSYINNTAYDGAKLIGLEEPFAKRTVEGDLGMRESSTSFMEEVGCTAFAKAAGITEEEARAATRRRNEDRAYVANTEKEEKIDEVIASGAVHLSARRHAGTLERGFLQEVQLLQHGKNLTDIKTIVGTGGIIVNAKEPHKLLDNILLEEKESGRVLLPESAEIFVDKDYVMFAAGLLAESYPQAAIQIMKDSTGIH